MRSELARDDVPSVARGTVTSVTPPSTAGAHKGAHAALPQVSIASAKPAARPALPGRVTMRAAAAVLLLAGAGSAQVLFSLQRLGDPRALLQLPSITLVRDPPPPAGQTQDEAPAGFKEQVEQRNAECYQQCANEFVSIRRRTERVFTCLTGYK